MADGVIINAGAGGATIATDDVGGMQYQVNKVAWGADGAVNHTSAAAPLPINVTTLPTLTKNTQGSTGLSTQDLKDAGRNVTNYWMDIPVITTATDALQSLTGYKSGAAVVATTTPAVVTAGKTYRVNSITLSHISNGTAGSIKFTLRALAGGTVLIGSPAVFDYVLSIPAATAGIGTTVTIPFPDGLEFAAGVGIGLSVVGLNTTQAAAIVGYAHASISGWEY